MCLDLIDEAYEPALQGQTMLLAVQKHIYLLTLLSKSLQQLTESGQDLQTV
jgi:hypothetical protein